MSFALRRPNVRKATLFACGCCRCAHDWSLPEQEEDALRATERYADGEILRRTWQRQRTRLESHATAHSATEWEIGFRNAVLALFYDAAEWAVPDLVRYYVRNVSSEEYADDFERKLCSALRDIFGNPFRKVKFDKNWRTDTAVLLAKQMYDARDFSAMPILADALQDAGCDSDDVLNHCRDANQVHVRGCWVVDLVLKKA
jgi:hypothetical protein